MIPFCVLSRRNLAYPSRHSTLNSRSIKDLLTLCRSSRSLSHPEPLFSTTSELFSQNTRGGIPLREFVRCAEAPKCLPVTPLLATLTHSVSRKSSPCHSYENTRDGYAFSTALLTAHCPLPIFVVPLFSYSYELLFSQVLSFENHPNCPGWHPKRAKSRMKVRLDKW